MEIIALELLTVNLEKTKTFYSDKLQLKIISENNFSISFSAGSTILTFTEDKKSTPVYHFAFNIPPQQLEYVLKKTEKEIDVIEISEGQKIAEFVNWNARSFYFYDATGNILEFIARFDLDIQSNDSFTFDSIFCVSEIGLVTEEVSKTCLDLMQRYLLKPYVKQTPMENFAAIGDHHGLLILSAANRNWYPTNIPARAFTTKIKIRENDRTIEILLNP